MRCISISRLESSQHTVDSIQHTASRFLFIICSSLFTVYCLLSTSYCQGEEQQLKELNQALIHIKESYYGTVDMETLVDSILRGVLDCLDKDSKLLKGEPPALNFVRGLEQESSISETKRIEPEIGYIKVDFFGRRTGTHFQKALETVVFSDSDPDCNSPKSPFTNRGKRGIKGLVLDLRDNPGGNLQSALEVLKMFVPPGKTLFIEKTKGGEKPYLSEGGCDSGGLQLPIVVLINGSTASSAEIVAATLRYHCGAKIVGEKSRGKGTIQEVIPLGTSTLILTVGEYLLPDGSSLRDKGIVPDLEVKGYEQQLQVAISHFESYLH